jgi:hypothetical protein
LAEYCLCAASDAPLAEEQPLYQARVPATVALRFVPRPVRVEVFLPGDDKPHLLDVQLHAPTSALLTRLCGEFKLVPADWRAYELLLEREAKEKSDKEKSGAGDAADSSLSSSSSKTEAGRRKRKRKQRRLSAARTLREQSVAVGATLRVVRADDPSHAAAVAGDDDDGSKVEESLYPEPSEPGHGLLMANGTLRAGSLCALLRQLTSPTDYDRDFMNTFLATYQSFMTPRQLLRRLAERFEVPATMGGELAQTIRIRVMVFVKNWISRGGADLAEVLTELQTFVGSKLATIGGDGLLRALDRAIEESKMVAAETAAAEAQRQMERLVRPAAEVAFIDCDARVMAYEMTCEAHRRYQAIRTTEFFDEAWNKQSLHHLCPNLLSLIDYFNHVACVVTYAIVSERGLRKRAEVMVHIIKLAAVLREFNNFHLLMSIVSVFSTSAVGRLKWTRARLPKKAADQLAEFEALMNVEGSFKSYRAAFVGAIAAAHSVHGRLSAGPDVHRAGQSGHDRRADQLGEARARLERARQRAALPARALSSTAGGRAATARPADARRCAFHRRARASLG